MLSLFDSGTPSETYGVSRFVTYIDRLLRASKKLQGISVKGEVTGRRTLAFGTVFNLKEGNDVLASIIWTNNIRGIPEFKDGDEVIAGGDIIVHRSQSRYQLEVKSLQLAGGVGQLYAQLAALKEKFQSEGLFEQSRKRVMGTLPMRIAVVSAQGKGAEDFLKKIALEAPHMSVEFVETRVQGAGAEIDIAEAIDRASRLGVDAIVVTRGGGSFEDLFPFNLEPVVRAIVRAKSPVITAVGHTGDHHLADDVADYTFTTPTRAAEHFATIRKDWLARVAELKRELDRAIRSLLRDKTVDIESMVLRGHNALANRVTTARVQVADLADRLNHHSPAAALAARGVRLKDADARLDAAMRVLIRANCAPRLARVERDLTALQTRVLQPFRQNLERLGHRLALSDPHTMLTGGRALLTTADGKLVTSSADVRIGETIRARLQHGMLEARVERTAADG